MVHAVMKTRQVRFVFLIPFVWLLLFALARIAVQWLEPVLIFAAFPLTALIMSLESAAGRVFGVPAAPVLLLGGVIQCILDGVILDYCLSRRSRWGAGLCQECGYDLRGSPGPRCPECGRHFGERHPLRGSVSKYDDPVGLATDESDWHASQ